MSLPAASTVNWPKAVVASPGKVAASPISVWFHGTGRLFVTGDSPAIHAAITIMALVSTTFFASGGIWMLPTLLSR